MYHGKVKVQVYSLISRISSDFYITCQQISLIMSNMWAILNEMFPVSSKAKWWSNRPDNFHEYIISALWE